MSDEGLHEIQLNGKQMVFLFMTATVIAVGIFLCGVLVGRGVPVPRTEVTVISDGVDPTVGAAPLVTNTPPPSTGNAVASPSADFVYDEQLGTDEPVVESLSAAPRPSGAAPIRTPLSKTVPSKTAPSNARAGKPVASAPSSTPRPVAATPSAAATTAGAPAGGFVVQVAAVRARAEAETIQRRLAGKGYRAFVTTSTGAGVTMYRVRVGGYDSRKAADSAATKLEREERFKTWVTR